MTEMRLQRARARAGVASRRAAEELIEQGKVRVDGAVATLGMKVDPEKQRITVSGRSVADFRCSSAVMTWSPLISTTDAGSPTRVAEKVYSPGVTTWR